MSDKTPRTNLSDKDKEKTAHLKAQMENARRNSELAEEIIAGASDEALREAYAARNVRRDRAMHDIKAELTGLHRQKDR